MHPEPLLGVGSNHVLELARGSRHRRDEKLGIAPWRRRWLLGMHPDAMAIRAAHADQDRHLDRDPRDLREVAEVVDDPGGKELLERDRAQRGVGASLRELRVSEVESAQRVEVLAAQASEEGEPLAKTGHPLSALYEMDNVIVFPHLTFYTREAMQRLEQETLERCFEVLGGKPVLVKSHDPRLRGQSRGVRFD